MSFNHRAYVPGETVAAIATPPGEGGVAIIRVSGNEALAVGNRIFSGNVPAYRSHTVHYGRVVDLDGNTVDQALLLVMKDGRSYTGEDTVEIHCHGGSLMARRVLELAIHAGARAAQPGEFTFKAYTNGKIDLAQAEAVQELISAKNEMALDAAEERLEGVLSKRVRGYQERLTEIAAILEAWVDFPEEGLEFASMDEVCGQLETISSELLKLIHSFHDGRILHEGISLCLVGSPNVGKSSLMNALLDRDRAIVTHIAGTTRDVLEDQMRINGLNVRLVDTAGIRETAELVEQEGIRRSREAMQAADLVLLLLDVTESELRDEERELLGELPENKTIVVWNKMDLSSTVPMELQLPHQVRVSAKERMGLEDLYEQIDQIVWQGGGPPSQEELVITNLRHKEALVKAEAACRRLIDGLQQGVSPEFLTVDMRECLNELGMILGTNITEDILSSIFSKFCIGK